MGGVHKKGIAIGEEAMIRITAGLCTHAGVWHKTPEEIIEKAKQIHKELFLKLSSFLIP